MELPYLTADLPGIAGALRTTPEDFVVDEQPAYPAAGTGDHVFVRIEKRGINTADAAKALARALGVAERDIGIAGMKDRHAVTRQWLSVPPPVQPDAVSALALEHIKILEVARHPHKLRTGHVRGNQFTLRVRGVAADAVERARAILERLAVPPGAPNWYGEQRFGRDGDNAPRGRAIVMGEPPPRDRRLARLLISALQSELFNAWLVARVTDGLYATAIAGDLLHKTSGGSMFHVRRSDDRHRAPGRRRARDHRADVRRSHAPAAGWHARCGARRCDPHRRRARARQLREGPRDRRGHTARCFDPRRLADRRPSG